LPPCLEFFYSENYTHYLTRIRITAKTK